MLPLTVISAKPWFEPDDSDIVKAAVVIPNEEIKWGGCTANEVLKWSFIQSWNVHLLECPCLMISMGMLLHLYEGWKNKNSVLQLIIKCCQEQLAKNKALDMEEVTSISHPSPPVKNTPSAKKENQKADAIFEIIQIQNTPGATSPQCKSDSEEKSVKAEDRDIQKSSFH